MHVAIGLSEAGDEYQKVFNVTLPAEIVEGSARGKVSITGKAHWLFCVCVCVCMCVCLFVLYLYVVLIFIINNNNNSNNNG